MTELRLIELEKAADEVIRLHEAIKEGDGYIDCPWPPGEAPIEEGLYSALENLKAALRQRSAQNQDEP